MLRSEAYEVLRIFLRSSLIGALSAVRVHGYEEQVFAFLEIKCSYFSVLVLFLYLIVLHPTSRMPYASCRNE